MTDYIPSQHSNVRGFNYQPSYGSNGFELWRKFDPDTIALELDRGLRYFPKIGAIQFWLSWDAFIRDPAVFAAKFEKALAILDSRHLKVMPVLFNRWHDNTLDYGGIYIDHFIPGNWAYREEQFDRYIEEIVGGHRDDPRIFAWDLCNEPCPWDPCDPANQVFVQHEYRWLEKVHGMVKGLGASAPVTIGTHFNSWQHEHWEPLSDFLSIHPYCDLNGIKEGLFEEKLDDCVAFAKSKGKAVLATETCWGHVNDADRVTIVRYTLGELKKREIGWLAYLLHHSLIADAHGPDYGPVGHPGNLSFIDPDGSIRAGHEIFNEY